MPTGYYQEKKERLVEGVEMSQIIIKKKQKAKIWT